MGLDLTLLPLMGPQEIGGKSALCHDRLSFDRDSSIFGQLTDLGYGCRPTIKANPIPPQLWVDVYEDEGIERTRTDKHGTELTFVYAQQLKMLEMRETASPKNKAIKAFIEALPNDTPIILLWG